MSEIVNLRQKRKQAARADARRKSDANAARHGQSKAERDLNAARLEKARSDLDQHRRDGAPGDGPAVD